MYIGVVIAVILIMVIIIVCCYYHAQIFHRCKKDSMPEVKPVDAETTETQTSLYSTAGNVHVNSKIDQ
jgi:hypothetical protein